MEIFSIGVGILGVIGIVVVGIQYMTAGGDEQKVTKAKRRMLEIVIGLACYVLSFGLLEWLGVSLNEQSITNDIGGNSSNSGNSSNNGGNKNNNSGSNSGSSNNKSSSSSNKSGSGTSVSSRLLSRVSSPVLTGVDKNGTTANGRKLISSAEKIAKEMASMGFTYKCNEKDTWEKMKSSKTICCHEFVVAAMQDAGLMPKGESFWLGYGTIHGYDGYDLKKNSNFKITFVNDSIKNLVSSGKLVPGDIVGQGTYHTMIYKGKSGGKYYFYSVNSPAGAYQTYSRVTDKTYKGSKKIFVIIHPK